MLAARVAAVVIGGIMAAVAVTCTELPSGPDVPFSITFSRAPGPSVVLGDTLRDSLGNVVPFRAAAYNLAGDSIASATFSFVLVARDSQPAQLVDGDRLIARSETAFARKTVRIFALSQGASIQSNPVTVLVTTRPDSMYVLGDSVVSDTLTFTDSLPLSDALQVRIVTRSPGPTPQDTTVQGWEVRYRIRSTASGDIDSSYVTIADGSRRRSLVDTTDAAGLAARQVRIRYLEFLRRRAPIGQFSSDTIRVEASATYRGIPLRGSPARFRVVVSARDQ